MAYASSWATSASVNDTPGRFQPVICSRPSSRSKVANLTSTKSGVSPSATAHSGNSSHSPRPQANPPAVTAIRRRSRLSTACTTGVNRLNAVTSLVSSVSPVARPTTGTYTSALVSRRRMARHSVSIAATSASGSMSASLP